MKGKTTSKRTAPSSSSRHNSSKEDPSPFREVDAILKCALLPSQIEFPLDSVKHQLNEMLFRYNYDLQGIPVSYSHIVFQEGKGCGRIMGEMPSVHIDIRTKLMVFQPKIGQQLYGKITKVRKMCYISTLANEQCQLPVNIFVDHDNPSLYLSCFLDVRGPRGVADPWDV